MMEFQMRCKSCEMDIDSGEDATPEVCHVLSQIAIAGMLHKIYHLLAETPENPQNN